jgi:hypothetical protein
VDLFGRSIRYEARADDAIQEAKKQWSNIEDMLAALDWCLMHDPLVGRLLNETGLRGFTLPGARSVKEPDVDVLYREDGHTLVIEDLVFRGAKASYAGNA